MKAFIHSGEILNNIIRTRGSQLVSSPNCDYDHDYTEIQMPPLVSPFHKIRTPTSEESNEAQQEKQGETIDWVCLVLCTYDTLPAATAVFAANAVSAAASCSAFKASNSLTAFIIAQEFGS